MERFLIRRTRQPRTFASQARLIGGITFLSRLLGLAREAVAANYFGAGAVWSAFVFAFTIPNLFRKLLGEGALSAAFIPIYAEAVEESVRSRKPEVGSEDTANKLQYESSVEDASGTSAAFAAASINVLVLILLSITLLGELGLLAAWLGLDLRPKDLLAVKLTMVMLPYATFICGAAFLGGILQVHHRFATFAATSTVLNAALIVAITLAALHFDLSSETGQTAAVYWLGAAVLAAGAAQCAMLLPDLRRTGVWFRFDVPLLTPRVRRMFKLSLPVAVGAGVLQVSVLLDRGFSFLLAASPESKSFGLFGHTLAYPLAEGAAARLNWAQFMYQFPLGVFAIALATAIFPRLSREAAVGKADGGRMKDEGGTSSGSSFILHPSALFRSTLREGVEAALFIGLPASVGLAMVAVPAVRVLFERGEFTPFDTRWTALSTALYSSAVWAFSLQQITNRAYYALHDSMTPLLWAALNLVVNVAVELPLLWTPLREAGMAVGTLVAFSLQAVAMLWLLNRRVGGIGLRGVAGEVSKMILASAVMGGAIYALRFVPGWPAGVTKAGAAGQLAAMMAVGGAVYFAAAWSLGVGALRRKSSPEQAGV